MSELSKDPALGLELLAIRCQLGEPGAIDELVERWHPSLWRYVRRLISDDSIAEEVHQDVWLRILRSIDRLRDPSRLAPWLLGIARRAVIDRLRQRYGEAVLVSLDDEPLAASENDEIAFDENETLHQTLEDLPWAEREALTLFYLRELDLNEVAAVLEVPPGTVKSRLHRARRIMRERLNAKGVTR